MPRLARKNLNTPFLHIMIQGVNKEYIFNENKYIEKYLEIIDKEKENYNFTILAYCIMNNHAHFLVYVEDIKNFGKFMQKLNLIYAQMYNKEKNRCGVLFRNRYQAEPIYDIKYLINCIKYIFNNPVKANIVSRYEDYKYSNYKDYKYNSGVTKSKIMKELFGSKYDYLKMLNKTFDKKFMDLDDNKIKYKYYLEEGIKEFKRNNTITLDQLFSQRELLKELIIFLKEDCGIKYTQLSEYLGISKSTINKLNQETFGKCP